METGIDWKQIEEDLVEASIYMDESGDLVRTVEVGNIEDLTPSGTSYHIAHVPRNVDDETVIKDRQWWDKVQEEGEHGPLFIRVFTRFEGAQLILYAEITEAWEMVVIVDNTAYHCGDVIAEMRNGNERRFYRDIEEHLDDIGVYPGVYRECNGEYFQVPTYKYSPYWDERVAPWDLAEMEAVIGPCFQALFG